MFAWKQKTNARSTIGCVMTNATERSSRTDFNLHKTRRKICCIILSSSHVVCLNWLLYSISKQDQLLKNETTIKSAQEAETTVQMFLQIKPWQIFLSSNRFLHVKVHININNNHQVFFCSIHLTHSSFKQNICAWKKEEEKWL